MEELYDISEVCTILGTTSRTLRFYEDKGLISCTKMLGSQRRKYSGKQLDEIRRVMTLRSIGLSVNGILDYLNGDSDIKNIIDEKLARTVAAIRTLETKLELLHEAQAVLSSGGDIFTSDICVRIGKPDSKRTQMVKECTECLLQGDITPVLSYFSERMRHYSVYFLVSVFKETVSALGKFEKSERIECVPHMQNIVFHYLRYEKLGLRIKYVFHDYAISGFWLDYYETGEIK